MERGEAVVTHREVFLQGSPRQAPVSRERSWGCVEQGLGPHIDVEAAPPQESWGLCEALSHTGLPGHSQPQTGVQHACTASTSLIAWGSPGWTPQPCCRVWGALGCHHTVPVQTDPSPWKRLSLGKSENGQTWELLG